MLEILPIMPALCLMLFNIHYAQNYAQNYAQKYASITTFDSSKSLNLKV